jgi:hypothetical protein
MEDAKTYEPGLESPRMQIVCGQEEVLSWQPRLAELSRQCGQSGAMDSLEYYLSRPAFARKRPTLILEEDTSQDHGLAAAVLLYEYQVRGIGCRVFSADYQDGARMVIAPAVARSRTAFRASAALLQRGAAMVHISYEDNAAPAAMTELSLPLATGRPRWAASRREMAGYLPLEETLEATLANLGKTTRRNLRRYRDRTEADLGHQVIDHPKLTREEFLEFNRISTHPVTEQQADWRYKVSQSTASGGLFMGLRAANGDWLSLIGGRTHEDSTHIEWQMNRADMPSYSLGTVMRSHLIEGEVKRGTRKLHFVGGNPLRSGFVTQKVVDLLVLRHALPRWMVRLMLSQTAKQGSHMGRLLVEDGLKWRPWATG